MRVFLRCQVALGAQGVRLTFQPTFPANSESTASSPACSPARTQGRCGAGRRGPLRPSSQGQAQLPKLKKGVPAAASQG